MPQRLDFKQIAQDVDVEAVAQLLGLQLTRKGADVRTTCPVCDGGERALQLYPETNSFCCHKSKTAGDCIGFYAHVRQYPGMYRAAKELSEHFLTAQAAVTLTAPQKPESRSQPAHKPFDPIAFGEKLVYSPEVKALGISEEDAERFTIGLHRLKVYFAIRDDTGAIAGFAAFANGELQMPKQWLPKPSNVVRFKQGA